MRSTPDLIAELEDESRQHFDVQMVVAFEGDCSLRSRHRAFLPRIRRDSD